MVRDDSEESGPRGLTANEEQAILFWLELNDLAIIAEGINPRQRVGRGIIPG
jgi:hypothetical protein